MGLQGCRLRGKPGSHVACSRSARECGGIGPHTPKGTPTLGVKVPANS